MNKVMAFHGKALVLFAAEFLGMIAWREVVLEFFASVFGFKCVLFMYVVSKVCMNGIAKFVCSLVGSVLGIRMSRVTNANSFFWVWLDKGTVSLPFEASDQRSIGDTFRLCGDLVQ